MLAGKHPKTERIPLRYQSFTLENRNRGIESAYCVRPATNSASPKHLVYTLAGLGTEASWAWQLLWYVLLRL